MTVKIFYCIALFVSAQFVSCFRQDDVLPEHPVEKGKVEIQQIIKVFGSTLKSKDTVLHKSLYLSNSSPINFNLKNQGSPFIFSLNTSSWCNFYPTFPGYYAEYTAPDITVRDGIAISNHHFVSYKSGEVDNRGNDMFMYVKTLQGFKILSINSTLVGGTDTTDYTSLVISGDPKDPFIHFTHALNQHDYTTYSASFLNDAVPCFSIRKQLTTEYKEIDHTSKAFFNNLPADVKLNISDLTITVRDQLTAEAVGEFYLSKNGRVIQRGTLMATVIATKVLPWKISTLVFSLR